MRSLKNLYVQGGPKVDIQLCYKVEVVLQSKIILQLYLKVGIQILFHSTEWIMFGLFGD